MNTIIMNILENAYNNNYYFEVVCRAEDFKITLRGNYSEEKILNFLHRSDVIIDSFTVEPSEEDDTFVMFIDYISI